MQTRLRVLAGAAAVLGISVGAGVLAVSAPTQAQPLVQKNISLQQAITVVKAAIAESCEAQKKGVTTFIEVILNQELGEPFRRDAMKKPVVVAGIKREDFRPQKV